MISRRFLLTIFTLPAFAFGYLSSTNSLIVYAAEECSAVRDLDKSLNRNQATVTNRSLVSCDYEVTLALYDSPQEEGTPGWIEEQTLIGSDTKVIKPGETVNFFVEDAGVTCLRQADLFEGSEVLEPPIYVDILDVVVYKNEATCITPTPTPEEEPTETPTPEEEGPTETPTPEEEPTETPTPEEEVSESLAPTGNSTFIYAIILSGAVSLIAGLILRKVSK